MLRKRYFQIILLICLALLSLSGCGGERVSTVLVTDSSALSGRTDSFSADVKPESRSDERGEAVEPFTEGSDPVSGKGSESLSSEESEDLSISISETDSTESVAVKKESFLEKLFHREPTTLDDSELEILRQARLVYLVFREKKLLAVEKAKAIRALLQEVGCEVIVRYCDGKSELAGEAIAEAVEDGAGTVIFDFTDLEIAEERITAFKDEGVRFISIGNVKTPGLSPEAVMLPDETPGVRLMASEASRLFPNGSYLFAGGSVSAYDLAEQFDDFQAANGKPFARVGDLSPLMGGSEENLPAIKELLSSREDLRFILCADAASAREIAVILKKTKHKNIGILCLYGEGNILELMKKGYVNASVMIDVYILAASVLAAFDSLAEKGNAGDYSLCYIHTLVRTAEKS